MVECNMCGECCKYVVVRLYPNFPFEMREYLLARGFKQKEGYLLLDCPCPHLIATDTGYICDLHDTGLKPKICVDFPNTDFYCYMPPECVFNERS